MVALPLFDTVLSSERSPERSARVAAQLVESALSELEQIEKIDQSLAPEDPLQFDRRTVGLLRSMYEQWARETQGLLERVARLEERSGAIAGAQGLRDAHGRTMAMLSISLEHMEEARQQVAEGRLIPIEEVRRELRLKVH